MKITYLTRLFFPVFIILAGLLFLAREDIRDLYRLYEQSGDIPTAVNLGSCRAEIQGRPVSGVKDNLSGLTWSAEHHLLFAVTNRPAALLWLTPEGERVGSMPLPGVDDPEAVVWAGGNLFWVGSEGHGAAFLVEADIFRGTLTVLSQISFGAYTREKDKGLEGLALDTENRRLYAAKEKKPLTISRVDMGTGGGLRFLPLSLTPYIRDISGLHYHAPTGSLLVLSDESRKVLEVTPAGQVTDRLYLTAGRSGLTADIPGAEGVALDGQGRLYIVSEPALFYRFSCRGDITLAPVAGTAG